MLDTELAEPIRARAHDRAPFAAPISTTTAAAKPSAGADELNAHSIRRWLSAALDELDYGVVVLDEASRVVHVSDAARIELDSRHALQRHGHRLRTRLPRDIAALQGAITAASTQGLRQLLTLGEASARSNLSIVPLDDGADTGIRAVLVVFAKRAVSETLSIEGYARSHGLTAAETRVLVALCAGVPPVEAAGRLGVAISTIRSQIGSIRAKTGATSIRSLVNQVALLPPVKGVLGRSASVAIPAASVIN